MINLYLSMTKRYKQFQPLVMSDFEVNHWHHPVHKHNHYELIYVKHGLGKHFINSLTVDYEPGDVFLLGPEEAHYFEIEEATRFVYLKFTDFYIHRDAATSDSGMQHLEYLIKSRETHTCGFKLSSNDQAITSAIFDVMLSMKDNMLRNEPLIWLQVLTLAHILQRNMPEIKANEFRSKDLQAVFCYIHKYIYQPEYLKAAVMAVHFNLSKDYIGPYFKRNTGLTLRNYISDYRNNLIKNRLNSRNFSLKQIAVEFGLTDESHVSKLLRYKHATW